MSLAPRAFCRATCIQPCLLHKYLTSTGIATANETATTPPTAAFRTVTLHAVLAALQDFQIAAALQHNLSSSAINAVINQTTTAVINRNTTHADSHAHPSPHAMIDPRNSCRLMETGRQRSLNREQPPTRGRRYV